MNGLNNSTPGRGGGNERKNKMENDAREHECGKCKHWHRWAFDRERKYWESNTFFDGKYPDDVHLHFGDCDKIERGQVYEDGETGTEYTYDGYSFEDEDYDEVLNCFEK